MTEPPVDLSPLADGRGDPEWERLARRIEAVVATELTRRATNPLRPGALDFLLRRGRWLIAASILLTLASTAVLELGGRARPRNPRAAALAALTGMTYETAGWLLDEGPPQLGQLLFIGEDQR